MPFVPDAPKVASRFVPDAPPGSPSLIPDTPPQPVPSPASSLAEKAEGIVDAGVSMATAIPAGIAGNVAGAVDTIAGGGFGTPEAAHRGAKRAQDVAGSLTYTPRGKAGQDALATAGRVMDASGIAGLNPGMAMPAIPGLKPAGAQARAATGTATAPVVEAAAKVGGKALDAVTPKVAPDVARLAQKAQDLGITLRPDMLTDNKIVRMIGEALEKVPLSGSKAEQRQQAFNNALGRLIGADEKAVRLTPDVFDRAMTQSGEKIGAITSKTKIPMSPEFQAAITEQVENAAKFETADVAKIISSYAKELESKAAAGPIEGEAFRKLNSKIGAQIRSTSNGDLKHALSDFQEHMLDALTANLNGPDLGALKEARMQYAIGKALEPLVAKSKTGDVSPAGLMGAVTSDKAKKSAMARGRGGELGDLAKIGQMFLKEPSSSGTTERGLAYGLLGGGAAINPYAAGGVYAGANVYNRAGPALAKRMTRLSAGDLPVVPTP